MEKFPYVSIPVLAYICYIFQYHNHQKDLGYYSIAFLSFHRLNWYIYTLFCASVSPGIANDVTEQALVTDMITRYSQQ